MTFTAITYIRRAPDWNGGFGVELLMDGEAYFYENMHALRQSCHDNTVFFICPPMADEEFDEINEHVIRMQDEQFPG